MHISLSLPEESDDSSSDYEEVPEESDDSSSDYEEMPEESDDSSSDYEEMPEESDDSSVDVNEASDESGMSISELYEQGQRNMHDAQQEAEDWADENGMTEWSDGTPRNDMTDEVSDEAPDDSQENIPEPSIAELYEQGQRDMQNAQQEAEDWADVHDVNAWSDGSMREGHEDDEYYRSSLDADQMEQNGLKQQEEYNKKH